MKEIRSLSKDERDKVAAYRKAMEDRKKLDAKSAEAVLPDAGMTETGEMPADPVTADRPMTSDAADTAHGAMPRNRMVSNVETPSATRGEMPQPPMNRSETDTGR
jgi:hypothetical protein